MAETHGLPAVVATARRRRGELIGGDQGRSLVADAERWAAGEAIRSSGRFFELMAPGFPGAHLRM
ncbi:MAG TPA: hypothetical protein VHF22_08670, partial [Planctomycetota bacterium]|nr:hypothetical protein [Planctomycetota bacterium]